MCVVVVNFYIKIATNQNDQGFAVMPMEWEVWGLGLILYRLATQWNMQRQLLKELLQLQLKSDQNYFVIDEHTCTTAVTHK